MLHDIVSLMGEFPKKMLRKGRFSKIHFDIDSGKFILGEMEPATSSNVDDQAESDMRKVILRMVDAKPTRDLMSVLLPPGAPKPTASEVFFVLCDSHCSLSELIVQMEEIKKFKDFLERLLQVDPTKRMNGEQALKHPFLIF